MKEGICFCDVKYLTPISAICSLTPYDLERLRKLAKSLYKITEVSHKGASYRARRFFKEPLKVIGIIITCVLVIGQSFFVKTIEVDGYRAIPETELRKVLAEAGIEEGSYRPSIDWKSAENLLYDSFPQIVWVQLVYDGRKVFLNIAETEDNEEKVNDETDYYCNIVATRSGYIESINTYRGLPLVEEGEYVTEGDILISGYVPTEPTVYDENYPKYYYVKSKGKVFAKVPYRLNFNQERYELNDDSKEKIIANKHEKTKEEAIEKVEQQIRLWAKENLPENAEILSKSLNFSYKESIIEIGVTLEVREEIGKEQEIVIGQKSTDKSGH